MPLPNGLRDDKVEGGRLGTFVMGLDYGFFCTKCCWAFMAVLVVVGAMNLLWMALFAGVDLRRKSRTPWNGRVQGAGDPPVGCRDCVGGLPSGMSAGKTQGVGLT